MKLSEAKKALIKEAQDWCDENDKSTEFMLQFMQGYANATHDEVIHYIEQNWEPTPEPTDFDGARDSLGKLGVRGE